MANPVRAELLPQVMLEINQEGAEHEYVPPHSDLPYGWDYPLQEKGTVFFMSLVFVFLTWL